MGHSIKKLSASYARRCLTNVDDYNRRHDTDYTVEEARRLTQGGRLNILKFPTFDDYLRKYYPQLIAGRRKREEAEARRQQFLTLPLSERVKIMALAEMAGCLKVHAQSQEQLEQEMALAMEIEAEEDMEAGLF